MPQSRLCPICETDDFHRLESRSLEQCDLEPAICRGCGLVLIDPMWSDAEKEEVVPSSRRLHRARLANAPIEQGYRRMIPRAQRCMDILRQIIQPGDQVLELGSGEGTLLRMLRDHGAEPVGSDLDPEGAKFVQQNFDIPVVVGPFEEADFGDRKFDAIVSAHVIEHVFEPIQVMQRARRLLKPGGYVFLETPNILRPKVGPRRLFSLPHNYYFSPRTLALILAKAGFAPLAVREFHRDSFQIVGRSLSDEQIAQNDPLDSLVGDCWEDVEASIRNHRLLYLGTLQFLWRKMPGVKNTLLYRIHRDLSGEPLDQWLSRAA